MTHIRGNLNKINELLKDSYTQNIVQTPTPYSFEGVVPAGGTSYFDVTGYTQIHIALFIQVSSTTLATQECIVTKQPTGEVLGNFYFSYDTLLEFSLGNLIVDGFAGESIRVYVINNAATPRTILGVLWILSL